MSRLERGHRDLTAEELVLLPVLLGYALGRNVGLEDLLPAQNKVIVGDFVARGRTVLAILSGPPQGVRGLSPSWDRQDRARDSFRRMATVVDEAARMFDLPAALLFDAAEKAGDLESKVAKRLEVTAQLVLAASVHLYEGRSLTAERDRLAGTPSAEDSERSARTRRGHITRQLVHEVEAAIREKEAKRGKRRKG